MSIALLKCLVHKSVPLGPSLNLKSVSCSHTISPLNTSYSSNCAWVSIVVTFAQVSQRNFELIFYIPMYTACHVQIRKFLIKQSPAVYEFLPFRFKCYCIISATSFSLMMMMFQSSSLWFLCQVNRYKANYGNITVQMLTFTLQTDKNQR